MAFEPINTQEEFDTAIKARLERERSTVSKQFEEKIAGLNTSIETLTSERAAFEKSANENAEKITSLTSQLEEANQKVSAYELDSIRTQVAIEKGLPMEIRNRLAGGTKEEIEKDADSLATFFKNQNNKNLPPFEPGGSDDYDKTGKVNEDRVRNKFIDSFKILEE